MGNKRDPVWEHFNATEIPFDSHLAAQCKLCFKTWKRGKPSELKAHLALKCPMVNHDIKIKYLQLVIILINDCFYFYIVLVIKIFNKSKI